MLICPNCGSEKIVKNGRIHNGKQRFKCNECNRQFVENPQKITINLEKRELIDRLLLERISLAGISLFSKGFRKMATNIRQQQICSCPQKNQNNTQKKGKLTIQCDELWSFVDRKGNKQWVWLALDATTREIVGVHIGGAAALASRDRDKVAARELWSSLPPVYRQCAVAYTDFWAAYGMVIPSQRHRAVGKETGKTSYIERFNNTLRQRVSRLVRKTLSFSKSLENHIGAIWYFIHYYNASLPL